MSVARNRAVWWPVVLTTLFVVTYLVPMRGWLFDIQLYRVSAIGAPAFLVYRELSGLADLATSIRPLVQTVLLALVTLCWFTFILLPFWSDFRIRGLSVRLSRLVFAIAGLTITVLCWLHLGGWRVHDA